MTAHRRLLNGNFMGMPDRDRFLADLTDEARRVTDDELTQRLRTVDWRSRLTAAWLIGIDRRAGFRAELTRLLLASELTYAGQGYAFALARLVPRQATFSTFLGGPDVRWRRWRKAQVQPGTRTFRRLASERLDHR